MNTYAKPGGGSSYLDSHKAFLCPRYPVWSAKSSIAAAQPLLACTAAQPNPKSRTACRHARSFVDALPASPL